MKRILMFLMVASCCAMAQESEIVTALPPVHVNGFALGAAGGLGGVVKGAPYSATITNESVQTLGDGTHITRSSSGTVARDSQGRTRQDAPLPAIGNLSATDAPHLVFLQDPVAGTSYTLNLTEKTAFKNSMPPGAFNVMTTAVAADTVTTNTVYVRTGNAGSELPPLPPPPGVAGAVFIDRQIGEAEATDVTTENLQTQVIEGVQATGVRTTQTIATGKIGNDRPIVVTTEVWTSPELKTIVLSKRNDPRMGEQTFKLTNIQRAEPDPSLFAVPADFKLTEGGAKTVIYKTKP
jgi:hypothetical protein